VFTLLLICPALQTALPPAAPPASQPADPEDLLWNVVVSLRELPAATSQPYAEQLAHVMRRREQLVDATVLYCRLHPGGRHLNDVIQIQLQALFELGSLEGGDYERLCTQVDEYLRNAPSENALHEAAYWAIICGRVRNADPAQPAFDSLVRPDSRLLGEYRDYVRAYPASRHVPRLATVLAEDALRRGDVRELEALSEALKRQDAQHPIRRWVMGLAHRLRMVGAVVNLELRSTDGRTVRSADWRGRPVLVVAWAGSDAASRACVKAVMKESAAHPEIALLGVNLDTRVEAMRTACRELGITWPQVHERHGLAGDFAAQWGANRLPLVLVIDRSGRLVGAAADDDWRSLLLTALNAPPASQP